MFTGKSFPSGLKGRTIIFFLIIIKVYLKNELASNIIVVVNFFSS